MAVAEAPCVAARLGAVMREGEQVDAARALLRPRLRARDHAVHGVDGRPNPSWSGIARGPTRTRCALVEHGGGYAWLTSVVDPEEGLVRLTIFGAMAGLPRRGAPACLRAFGDDALLFAVAYGVVRVAHIALFTIASRDDPALQPLGHRPRRQHRHRASRLLAAAAGTDGWVPGGALGCLALLPRRRWARSSSAPTAGSSCPGHFAERHGLIVLIALGESIVAIGVGAGTLVDGGVVPHGYRWGRLSRQGCGGCTSTFRRSAPSIGSAKLPSRPRAERARPRRLLVPSLPDGRGDRAGSRWA